MSISKIMTKEMAKAGGKVKIIPNNYLMEHPDFIIAEWIKWLSYESDVEKKRMEYFDNMKVSELSNKELKMIIKHNDNKEYAELFKKYKDGCCTESEYMRVYKYMCSHLIDDLMLNKLSSEELKYAKKEIVRLGSISDKELGNKIKDVKMDGNYENLSMVDAYILHVISGIHFVRNQKKLINMIDVQIKQNELMREKSLYYAKHPYDRR